ncbi:protein phosphatase 1L isoform X2 [Polyodon spathula]|uniref:protein phosphatase 1L isoform X2 n=1 Tax=Polyodon spathula TaxID=7913 RepID=UPI001B7E09C6|nr:protein phosphatase 1L isoform X2 [Polyodon spathula]
MIEDTMTLLSLLGRIMRYFLLRPETLFLLCISLALWSYFFHTDEVKTIVKSSRDAVKMVKGKVAEIMQNDRLGGIDVLEAEFSKTWEFKSHNVAVYSIQGRREHMEDRFRVITDLVNKTHPSIFGIFDGHGGESAAEYVKTHLPEVLKQQLLNYEKDKENSVLSYQSILEQHILSIDKEMLDKLSASYDEAGDWFLHPPTSRLSFLPTPPSLPASRAHPLSLSVGTTYRWISGPPPDTPVHTALFISIPYWHILACLADLHSKCLLSQFPQEERIKIMSWTTVEDRDSQREHWK